MTEVEFESDLAEETGLTKKEAKAVVAAFKNIVARTLRNGDFITFVGFGKFSTKHHDAHKGLNPVTREEIEIPAKTTCYFKPGKQLADAVKCE